MVCASELIKRLAGIGRDSRLDFELNHWITIVVIFEALLAIFYELQRNGIYVSTPDLLPLRWYCINSCYNMKTLVFIFECFEMFYELQRNVIKITVCQTCFPF